MFYLLVELSGFLNRRRSQKPNRILVPPEPSCRHKPLNSVHVQKSQHLFLLWPDARELYPVYSKQVELVRFLLHEITNITRL